MRPHPGFGVAFGLVLVVGGCTSAADDPTTTQAAPPTTTTTVETTTTTAMITTTTSPPTATTQDPWTVDYPENPQTVDDIPDALTVHIGASVPGPDLTISGPEDLDRWMAGWLDWLAWIHANPAEGVEQLQVNMIPGSEQFDDIRSALLARAEAEQRLVGGGFLPVRLSGTFDEFFEDKTALRIVMVAEGPPSYLVNDTGEVVSVFEGLDGEVTVSALLRYETVRDAWVMETFEVLGRS